MSDTEDIQAQLDALSERIEALGERPDTEGADPVEPVDPEQRFARELATRLDEAQSRWYSTGGDGGPS
jgi:hypothetical protein